jgi:hypothetical protein
MPQPTNAQPFSLWFAWKGNPKVEHEAHSGASLEELQPHRDRLAALSDIDHVKLYRRTADGQLEDVAE